MARRRVIVVGGGAAGLVAAARSAEAGAETLLMEKMDRPGRKLGISGNGRCNVTNLAPPAEFLAHFGPRGRFLRFAVSQFSARDMVGLLKRLGVKTVVEGGGRVFPASGRAQDVVDALVAWATRSGAKMSLRSPVARLVTEAGRLVAVRTAGDRQLAADAAIVATGGASYPATGSSGGGYRLAAQVGHTIVPTRPALVPLETAGARARALQGLSLRDTVVRVLVDRKKRAETSGELIFTHSGVSGPAVLTVSRQAVDALAAGAQVELVIDLAPDRDQQALNRYLLSQLAAHGKQRLVGVLKRMLPARLALECAEAAGISPDTPAHQLTAPERRRLSRCLKEFRLEVVGHRPLAEAIVTAGGIDTREVQPRTLASRLVSGLYFAGEVLDIDADTGGFNLQAAFSTGWVAGQSAAAGFVTGGPS